MSITSAFTGKTRHRMAIVKEGFFSKKKAVLILQYQMHDKGTYYSNNDPTDFHGLDVDKLRWVDAENLFSAKP